MLPRRGIPSGSTASPHYSHVRMPSKSRLPSAPDWGYQNHQAKRLLLYEKLPMLTKTASRKGEIPNSVASPSRYRFTCALTGYSLNTTKENLVEAAHIHQHALSGDYDPRNGLAVTPDAHWMFDRGLWTAEPQGEDFLAIVARGHFKDSSGSGQTLYNYS